ncbi:MAG TPA: tRNA (adenosine(37)-N6)-threonylcarbamoyltransferase complex transferase subunit TsaD [Trichormus sp.]|jgi:N6-L-threonylcarbamoyladenine synthase
MGRLFLALETSCDETAVAVVEDGRRVLSSQLVSQINVHQQFGGVVPEVAARRHVETINELIDQVLAEAQVSRDQLDSIACTAGPGLIGTLLVGLSAAKALSWAWDLPLIAVDHLLSHVCANYLGTDLEPPFVALLVSGGHTQIMHFETFGTGRILGQTLDDAAGEAFDKVARLLGLGYPGGPAIDRISEGADARAFPFPEGVVAGYDFSFSGLKTAVLRRVEKMTPPLPVADLAASFQDAVTRVLVRKTVQAQKELGAPRIVLAGGVAANRELRKRLTESASVPVYFPSMDYCTDNAAMVASAAYFCGNATNLSVSAYSRQR